MEVALSLVVAVLAIGLWRAYVAIEDQGRRQQIVFQAIEDRLTVLEARPFVSAEMKISSAPLSAVSLAAATGADTIALHLMDEHEGLEHDTIRVRPRDRRPIVYHRGARYVAARELPDGSFTYRHDVRG